MQITISTDNGIIMAEIEIDEATEKLESGRDNDTIMLSIISLIEANFAVNNTEIQ